MIHATSQYISITKHTFPYSSILTISTHYLNPGGRIPTRATGARPASSVYTFSVEEYSYSFTANGSAICFIENPANTTGNPHCFMQNRVVYIFLSAPCIICLPFFIINIWISIWMYKIIKTERPRTHYTYKSSVCISFFRSQASWCNAVSRPWKKSIHRPRVYICERIKEFCLRLLVARSQTTIDIVESL